MQGKQSLVFLRGKGLKQFSPHGFVDHELRVFAVAEQHGDFLVTHRLNRPHRGQRYAEHRAKKEEDFPVHDPAIQQDCCHGS